MIEILIPGLILGGFALISSTGLFIAAKKFYVYEDPRIAEVTGLLPGANCGGCGFAGCAAYADYVVANNTLNKPCPVADDETMSQIGALLGLAATSAEKKVASLMCKGTSQNCKLVTEYTGIEDCWAAMLVNDTTKACSFSCLGLSTCVRACAFDAMRIEEGIVVIDDEKCTGCGMCISSCPKNILHMRPKNKIITVTCFNTDRGAESRKACAVACIGCMKCEKACEDDAIHVNNFLAKIDYIKCTLCEKCVEACPTNAIEIRRIMVDAENV